MNHLRLLAFLSLIAGSSSAATITGTITNNATGAFLEDATISVQPINIIARSNELGRFDIQRLPLGTYNVTVSYTDLESQTKTITLTAEAPDASADFPLNSAIYKLETFVVTGTREGDAAAISRQQSADNIRTVASLDSYGYLSNDNPADLLFRLPGITGNVDEEGNVESVNIRGISPDMNIVTYDGAQMTTSGGADSRSFRFLNISAASFSELEVIKALTPKDNPASLGGTVNMKTKSTLTMKENLLFTYQVGVKFTPGCFDYTPRRMDDPYGINFMVGYKQIFSVFGGRRNLGISLDLDHADNITNFAKATVNWQPRSLDDPAYMTQYIINDAIRDRVRDGATLRFDYQFNKNNRIYLSLLYTQTEEDPKPGKETYNAAIAINPSGGDYSGNIIMEDLAENFTPFKNARVQITQGSMGLLDKTSRIQFGGEHFLSNWKIDYAFTYANTRVHLDGNGKHPYSGMRLIALLNGTQGTLDLTDGTGFVKYTQTGGGGPNGNLSAYDPNSYVSANTSSLRMEQQNAMRQSTNYEGQFNAQTGVAVFGQPVQITSGLAWRQQFLSQGNNTSRWFFDPNRDLSQFTMDYDIDSRFGSGMGNLPKFDIGALSRDLINNRDLWVHDNEAEYYYTLENQRRYTYDITEDIAAAYIMGRTQYKKLGVLAGIRIENTSSEGHSYKVRSNGNLSSFPNDPVARVDNNYGDKPITVTKDYTDYFPSVHFTYSFTKNLLARLSWSTSIGRPIPRDLLPTISVSSTTVMELRTGNTDLVPQYANNFDFSLEYYLKPSGLISIGVFRKEINDFIFSTVDTVATGMDNGFEGAYNGWDYYKKYNGEKATVEGIEAVYQQDLRFLPKPLNGFNLRLNATILRTEGNYGTQNRDPLKDDRPLNLSTSEVAGFIPMAANARLSYRYKDFSCFAAINYTDSYLESYSLDSSRLCYRKERLTLDVGFSYRITRWAEFNFVINNVTDEPSIQYFHDESRRRETIYNGPIVNCALRGRF